MHGDLSRERLCSGEMVGRCVLAVDGLDSLEWVKQQARDRGITEARLCRNLLNKLILSELRDAAIRSIGDNNAR